MISSSSPRQNPGHQQDTSANAGIAQGDRFIERSHAQPACSFFLQRSGAFRRAMTIRVGLHHRAHRDTRSDVPLHDAEVIAQIFERYISPRGSGSNPLRDFNGRHLSGTDFNDISAHRHYAPLARQPQIVGACHFA